MVAGIPARENPTTSNIQREETSPGDKRVEVKREVLTRRLGLKASGGVLSPEAYWNSQEV